MVAQREGSPIYVRDVAEVKEAPGLRFGAVTRDGKEVALGIALARINENAKNVVDAVKAKLSIAQQALPKGVTINPGLRPHGDRRQGDQDGRERAARRLDPGGHRAVPVSRRIRSAIVVIVTCRWRC